MKKHLLLLLCSLLSFTAFAQVPFDPGYIVDNNGNRIECFIKNYDRLANPSQVEYRLSEEAALQVATVENIREFEIYNTVYKYQRHTVEIDVSSNVINALDTSREPVFQTETLFLKVMLAGKASLYTYRGPVAEKYFFRVGDAPVEQLVHKKYLDGGVINENNAFRQQLWLSMQCKNLTMGDFEKLKYSPNQLLKLFVKYNECESAAYVIPANTQAKSEMNSGELSFAVRAGVGMAFLEINNRAGVNYINSYGPSTVPQVGFEVEYVMPFHRKQWSVFLQPAYQHYRYDHEGRAFGRDVVYEVNYSHLNIPLGIRRSVYLNEQMRFFINGAVAYHYLLNSTNPIEINNITLNADLEHDRPGDFSTMYGAGIKFKKRYSLEASYQTGKVMVNREYWGNSMTSTISLQVGVRLK
jgi:hypothetical protein